MDLNARAHLPAVGFSRQAYMGCGGWDLARAPKEVAATIYEEDRIPTRASSRFSRPRRTMGCGSGGFSSQPVELIEPDEEVRLSCGGENMPEEEEGESEGPIVTLQPGLSGSRTPRVRMGCGDEMCEECAAKAAGSGIGCRKCKRIRKHAGMNQDNELEGRTLGQAAGLPDLTILVTSGLVVAGLFYLVTR